MVFAVALGVAVVLAIDLAGNAAAGSFHSSMETLTGDNNLEVTAAGGVPESVVGTLATLPYPIRISARIEDYAVVEATQKTVPLIGLDVIAEADRIRRRRHFEEFATKSDRQSAQPDRGTKTRYGLAPASDVNPAIAYSSRSTIRCRNSQSAACIPIRITMRARS